MIGMGRERSGVRLWSLQLLLDKALAKLLDFVIKLPKDLCRNKLEKRRRRKWVKIKLIKIMPYSMSKYIV